MEQIAPLLEKLAAQLGVTVAYLWAISVKQSYVYAFYFGALSLTFAAGSAIVWRLSTKCAEGKGSYDLMSPKDWRRVWSACLFFMAAIFILESFVRLWNPEYYALARILEALD